MPLKVNFALPGTKTRKRLEDPYQTDAELYGQIDPTQALGRTARSGAEAALGAQIPKLNFDPVAERTARTNLIERAAQQEKEALGRQFALTPGGTTTPGLQGGEQQRGFELLSSNVLNLKDALESELSQRTGAESRANAQALQGIQQGVEQGALNAGQLNLSAVSQGLQAQGQGFTQGLQEGELTGEYGGKQTLQGKATTQDIAASQAQVNIAQQAQDLSNRIQSGQLTIQQAQQNLQDRIQTGELSIAQADQILRQVQLGETQRQFNVSSGLQSRQIDIQQQAQNLAQQIQTGQLSIAQAQQNLNEKVQLGQLSIDQANQILNQAQVYGTGQGGQTAAERQAAFGRDLSLINMFGEVPAGTEAVNIQPGQQTLAGRAQTEQERQNLAQETLQGRSVSVSEKAQAEQNRQNQAIEALQARGIAVTEGNLKEEMRRNLAEESLQSRGIAVTENSLNEEVRRNKANEALQAATVFGAGLVLPDGTPITVRNGRDAYDQSGNYVGRYDADTGTVRFADGRDIKVWTSTEEVRKNKAQETIQNTGLTEEKRRNQAIEALQGRGLDINKTSVDGEIQAQKDRQKLAEEQAYGGSITKNADGTITFRPTMAYQQMTNDQKLQYKQLTEQARQADMDAKVQWAQVTGVAKGQPGVIGISEFKKAIEDAVASKGTEFDPAMDFNGDGELNFDDFFYGNENGLIVPDGQASSTLQARQLDASIKQASDTLGLESRRLTETMALNREQMKQEAQQFASSLTGYLTDETGNPKYVWKPFSEADKQNIAYQRQQTLQPLNDQLQGYIKQLSDPTMDSPSLYQASQAADAIRKQINDLNNAWAQEDKYGGRWSQPESLDIQKFNETKRQFNATSQQTAEQFAQQMGLAWAELNQDERLAIMQVQQQQRNSMFGFLGALGGTAGVIAGSVADYLTTKKK